MKKLTMDLGNDEQLLYLAARIMFKVPELNKFSLEQVAEIIKTRISEIMGGVV